MKKLLALVLAVLMIAAVCAGCGGGGNDGGNTSDDGGNTAAAISGDISLKVWAPEKAKDLAEKQCKAFAEKYADQANITIEVVAQGEGDAATALLNDPDTAADVFSFPSDQLNKLQRAGVIAPVFDEYLEDVKTRNSAESVDAGTIDDQLMAFPETGDNGYYLVYDKSVVSDEDAKSLESILEACKKAGKKFIMDAGNGFYSCTFPFTGGLEITGLEDGVQQFNDYNEDEIVDTLVAFAELFHSYAGTFESNSDSKIASGMAENPSKVAAGVDGSWDAAAVSKALGENFGAAKLPTIKVNGEDKQLVSMHGYKYIGVNMSSKNLDAAELLADYLTNEECQLQRAEEISWGPSNIKAAESDSVKNNIAVSAILAQSEHSIPQVDIADTFWNPMGNLGNEVYKGEKYDKATMKDLFETTIANIKDE